MKFPLIIYEGGDVRLFYDLQEAEGHYEGQDVLAGCYKGFDADGHPLIITAPQGYHGTSAIQVDNSHTNQPELTNVLKTLLTHFKVPEHYLDNLSLNQLIETSALYLRLHS